jgi:NitT/TauT family transport system substrate-binding protein
MGVHRHRRLSLAGIIAGIGVLAAACSSSPGQGGLAGTAAAGRTTVTVAYVPIPLFSPLFIAMSRGYFTQHGINVKLLNVANGQDAIALAAQNRVQVVLGGFSAGMFDAVHSGLNFKVVGSMAGEPAGTPADGLVVAAGLASRIRNPAGLRGMKVGVNGGAGSAGAYLLAAALAPYHLTLRDVTLVNLALPEQESALKSQAVAAAYMSSPFLSAATSSGAGKLIARATPGTSVTGVIYGGTFAGSKAAQPFFDALAEGARGLQGAQATSAANLKIEAKATGQSLSVLEREPANVFSPRLTPPTATLDAMQKVFLADGDLNYHELLFASTYVDTTFSAHVPGH